MSIYIEAVLQLQKEVDKLCEVTDAYQKAKNKMSFPIVYWQGKLDGIELAIRVIKAFTGAVLIG